MSRPHPKDFTVDIKQHADGTWRIQIREVPAYWGEGPKLSDALDALRKRAVPAVSTKGAPDAETLRGAAAAFAAEGAVESYIEAEQRSDAADDDSESWDDVSVISFRRKPPPTSGSSGDPQ